MRSSLTNISKINIWRGIDQKVKKRELDLTLVKIGRQKENGRK